MPADIAEKIKDYTENLTGYMLIKTSSDPEEDFKRSNSQLKSMLGEKRGFVFYQNEQATSSFFINHEGLTKLPYERPFQYSGEEPGEELIKKLFKDMAMNTSRLVTPEEKSVITQAIRISIPNKVKEDELKEKPLALDLTDFIGVPNKKADFELARLEGVSDHVMVSIDNGPAFSLDSLRSQLQGVGELPAFKKALQLTTQVSILEVDFSPESDVSKIRKLLDGSEGCVHFRSADGESHFFYADQEQMIEIAAERAKDSNLARLFAANKSNVATAATDKELKVVASARGCQFVGNTETYKKIKEFSTHLRAPKVIPFDVHYKLAEMVLNLVEELLKKPIAPLNAPQQKRLKTFEKDCRLLIQNANIPEMKKEQLRNDVIAIVSAVAASLLVLSLLPFEVGVALGVGVGAGVYAALKGFFGSPTKTIERKVSDISKAIVKDAKAVGSAKHRP